MSCAVLLALGTGEMQAQGLGGLLKKVKKGVETVAGTAPSSTTASTSKPSGTDVPAEGAAPSATRYPALWTFSW